MSQENTKDSNNTKEKVIQSTLQIIIEDGYKSITWRKISQKSNLSPGTLTYYFKDIDDIVILAFNTLIEKEIINLINIVNKSNNITDFCNNITELISSEYSKKNYLLLNVELSCLALRNESYKKLYQIWMKKTQMAYSVFLTENKSKQLDALIEGLTLHSTMSEVPYSKSEIFAAIQLIINK